MKELLKMASRNLLRYKRRSLLTGLGMLLGGFILTFNQAYSEGIERQLIANMIASNTGHIMITAKQTTKGNDFEESFYLKKSIIKDSSTIEKILQREPGVKSVAKRINIVGMLSNGLKFNQAIVIGIEPEKEQDLLNRTIPAEIGTPINNNDSLGIYISHSTAAKLKVGLNDTLTLLIQTPDGSSNALDFTVKGIFKKTAPWAEGYSYIKIADACQLMMLQQGASQFNVMLNDPNVAKTKAADLRERLSDKFQLDIKDWRAAGGFFFGSVIANQVFGMVLCFVLFIIVAASIMNTMLMAVFERTREIGTMMALGTKRRQILGLFITEAGLLGIISAGFGILLGSILALWLGQVGIPAFTESMSYGWGGDRAYPYLTIANIFGSYCLIVILTVLASLYPAHIASHLKPIEALTIL